MATVQIRGNTQIMSDTITNTQINSSAAIATSKLADGANFLLKDGSVTWTADHNAGGFKLTNLATPTASGDAATKGYVDAAVTGLSWKDSVRVATTAALTLATDFENGDTVDGITLATGDRILIKNQASSSANGIYIVAASGAPTRATDADTAAELEGAAVFVEEGTTNANSLWVQTADNFTLDTDPVTWVQFQNSADITAGAGLTRTGNSIDAVAADDSLTINADSLQVKRDGAGAVGLTASGVKVNTDGTSVEISSNNLRIASGAAGDGLGYSAGVLSVNAGTGIALSGDNVTVNSTTVLFKADAVYNETPTGAVDGANTTYTLANTPVAGTISVFLNGLKQRLTTDYTVSGTTVTMTSAPLSGDAIRCEYLK